MQHKKTLLTLALASLCLPAAVVGMEKDMEKLKEKSLMKEKKEQIKDFLIMSPGKEFKHKGGKSLSYAFSKIDGSEFKSLQKDLKSLSLLYNNNLKEENLKLISSSSIETFEFHCIAGKATDHLVTYSRH